MLCELRVENLLLIEQAQLRLASGLNVLTGETGAGKTVLAHALDLLLGGRARTAIVRPGATEAYVEGVFALPQRLAPELRERLPSDVEEIVLARRVDADGRTRAYLNGRVATVGDLRDIGGALVAFYGQHEHRKLTISAAQLELLDGLCGPEQATRLRACAEVFGEVGRVEAQLQELGERAEERARELDLLEYEIAEIDAAEDDLRSHEQLLVTRERLRRVKELRDAAGWGADALAPEDAPEGGAGHLLAGASSRIDALAGVDPRLDTLAERLRGLLIECRDLGAELHRYGEDLDGRESAEDGGELDGVEARIAVVDGLMRKHGGGIESVLDHGARAHTRRAELLGARVALGEGDERLRAAREELERIVVELRRARTLAAPVLQAAVREQLSSLAMAEASFDVAISACDPGAAGADGVEFMIAPNPGVPAGPLREIASGGELSRIMLAIMGAAAAGVGEATLVFDEVDAGIGGHAARAVGSKLRALAQRRQLLCITHLPQIASLSDRHFAIVKDTGAKPTRASVTQLGEPEVVSELVRMLGADSSDSGARRHARELRRAA